MSSEDSGSSSEEDLPLSALKNSFGSSGRGSRRSSRSSKTTSHSYKELSDDEIGNSEEEEFDDGVEDDESDEDDVPLSQLISPKRKSSASKKQQKKNVEPKAKKGKAVTTKAKSKAKTTPPKKKALKKSESLSSSTSGRVTHSSELYSKSKKGKLISEFLCRWWYAMTWPEPESLPVEIPSNCDAMDGFPGVYVTTSGDDIGKILDLRNKDTCPNFINMSKKSSAELRELLLKAIEEQRRVLIDAEGTGTKTEKDLKALQKWAEKVNPKTSDAEAKKVLKAAGLG